MVPLTFLCILLAPGDTSHRPAVGKLVGMQVDALELKVTMAQDSPGFATVSALEALEEVVSKIAGSTNAKDMERKLETLRFIIISCDVMC